MITPMDISRLHPMARKALDPSAPEKLRIGAARGILPGLPGADVVSVVAQLTASPDAQIAESAAKTLAKLPPPILEAAFSGELHCSVLDALARHNLGDDALLVRVLDNSGIDSDTVAFLAEIGSEGLCEHIAINEKRLLECPVIAEKLYMNPRVRMSTADRVLELTVRNGIELNIPAYKEAATAIRDELIAEPSEEPTPDDILYQQVSSLAESAGIDPETENVVEIDDEGQEAIIKKLVPIWVQIGSMTISQKIRLALIGSGTERMLLVRDKNRLVSCAAVRSPKIKENEIVQISSSKAVSDDVLRIIAANREWTQNHQVKYNLVCNPRTPLTFASQLIPHLRDHELKAIAKSKNVTGAISQMARHHLMKKQQRG
ncbi:MAG: hypothetical protein FWD57_09620 [Polyangiaceae bacterium]|nr:hypothetical protein [Polyangiaceae bacterium]